MGNLQTNKTLNNSVKVSASVKTQDSKSSNIIKPNNVSIDKKNNVNKQNTTASSKNSKQKVVLPTLRETQRYLVYRLILNDKLNGNNVLINDFDKIHSDIISKCNTLLGIFESAKAGLMSAKYDSKKMSGIIRVDSKYVDKLKVCLGMIKNSCGKNFTIECVFVSGVINKAIDKMNYNIN